MDDLYFKAARRAIRFDSPKGQLTVEDLFNLPLTSTTGKANLNNIAIALHSRLEATAISFVDARTESDADTNLAFEIVKDVIRVKMMERVAAETAANKAATRQKIMSLIEQKSDMSLAEKSIDELTELLKSL